MRNVSSSTVAIACALLALTITAGCEGGARTPAAHRQAVVPSDAAVRAPNTDTTGGPSARSARIAFESREGTFVARRGGLAVLANATGLAVDGPSGRLLALAPSRASRRGAEARRGERIALGARGEVARPMGPNLVETLTASPAGAEQTWELAARPEGGGALTLEVPVQSGRYVGSDARGLRFAGEGGEVVYSHGTFIDATGARTSVPARFVDGVIVLRVEAETLDGARYPAVLDPTISAVVTLAGVTPGASFPAFGDQRFASFAPFDATLGLIAYVDAADPAGLTLDAVRVDATGTPVGAVIRLATGVSLAKTEMACNASECLVVFLASGSLRAVRVDSSGTVLDATPVPIASVGSLASLALEDDGAGRILVWADRGTPTGTTSTVNVCRLGADGRVVAGPIEAGTANGASETTVASIAGTTLVVWDDVLGTTGGRLRAARFDASLARIDPSAVTLLDDPARIERLPRLVRRTGDLVLVFLAGTELRTGAVTLTPSPTVPAATAWFVTSGPSVFLAATTVDGTNLEFLYGRIENSSIRVSRVHLDFALNSYQLESIMDRATVLDTFEIAPMNGGSLVVASLDRPTTFAADTNGFDVQAATNTLDAHNVTVGAASARAASATYVPSNFAVASITDDANVGARLTATRITPVGAAVDSPPTPVVSGTFTSQVQSAITSASLAQLGSQFFVAWRRFNRGLFGSPIAAVESASVDATGPPNVGILRVVPSAREPFGLLSGSPNAMLVYSDGSYARRMSVTPTTFGNSEYYTELLSVPNVRTETSVGVAWGASAFGVLRPGVNTTTSLAVPTTDDGGLGIADGTRSMLVVRRNGPGSSATTVQAILLNATGSASTRAIVTVNAGVAPLGPPRVVFDGTHYDVFFSRGDTLYLARVDEDGVVLDLVPSVVATGAYPGRAPVVATDRAGKVLFAHDTYDPTPGVRALRVSARIIDWNAVGSGAANGTACNSVLQCASGHCIDGVCCESACGFGATNDCQACSAAANGTAPDGTCGPTTAAVVCRAAAGPCDAPDTCNGTSTVCPADTKVAAGTVCGAPSTQPCETAQMCNGVSDACQGKQPAQGNPVCRPAATPCDVPEVCNGFSTVCPSDAVAPSTTVCRPANGPCDAPDRCTGFDKQCGADAFFGGSTVCRPVASPCDRADVCDGTGPDCPVDLPAASGTQCRSAAGPCDAPETCDGQSHACPADAPAEAGTPCRSAVSVCDVPEQCDGASFACPVDGFAAPTVACRGSVGVCDSTEFCTGTSSQCPPFDGKRPSGFLCRAANGPCDVPETCDGVSNACGSDALRPAGAVCRPAAGLCDVAETCSGLGRSCPLDRDRVDGSACGDGLVCNGDEVCQAGECVAGEPLVCAAENPCIESTGRCSVASRPAAAGCSISAPTPRTTPGTSGGLAGLALAMTFLHRRRRRRVRRIPSRLSMLLALVVLASLAGCVCGVGGVACDGACVDVGYDERNCGACGVSCGVGQCIDGVCVTAGEPGAACDHDDVCLDGDVCNGVERCIQGRCRAGETLVCDDGLACSDDRCDSELGSCVSVPTTVSCGLTSGTP